MLLTPRPPRLRVATTTRPHLTTVAVTGSVVPSTTASFEAAIGTCLADSPDDVDAVAVDMSGVTALCYAGVAALIAARDRALHQGTALSVVHPSPAVAKVLADIGLQSMLVRDTSPDRPAVPGVRSR